MADSVDVTLLDEDPVSFLANIGEYCPDIFSILTTKQVKLLSQTPPAPYSKGNAEKEHLSDAWEYLKVRSKWNQCTSQLNHFVLTPRQDMESSTTHGIEIFDRKKIALEKVYLYMIITLSLTYLLLSLSGDEEG